MNIENREHPAVKTFARALLATTCLTGVAGVAGASTIIEGIPPAPSDFGNFFGFATFLPAGANVVFGSLTDGTDPDDFFVFQNLPANAAFSVTAAYIPLNQEAGLQIGLYNTSGASLGTGTLEGSGATIAGLVPGNGDLVVDLSYGNFGPGESCGNCEGAPSANGYRVSLTTGASTTPEPASFALTGLALSAGALAWRRRRRTED